MMTPKPCRFAVVVPGIFSGRSSEGDPILKAGGDIRAARILSERPPNYPTPVLFASRSAITAFRDAVSRELEGYSIDNVFEDVSGNVFILSIVLVLRALTSLVALNLTRVGRSASGLYSTSNALPDVIVCTISNRLFRRSVWVAVVHHIPEKNTSESGTTLYRVLSRLSFGLALCLVARYASSIIAYHEPTIGRLKRLGVAGNRLNINANGVDLGEIERARIVAPPRRDNAVLCVGRLSPQKGTLALIRIWREVVRERPTAKLTLVGAEDALTKTDVMTLIQTLDLADSVSLLGVVPRSKLLSELLSSRLLVAPSFVEGWGLAVLEGLACGTPVVAWGLEAYEPFRPAVIEVPLSNATDFARQILVVMDNDEEWHARSTVSMAVSRAYSWIDIAEREWRLLVAAFGPGQARKILPQV